MYLILFTYFLLPDVEVKFPCPTPLLSKQGIRQAAGLAEGLVRIQLLNKTMTSSQLTAIIGAPSLVIGGGFGSTYSYEKYGIQVIWGPVATGKLRPDGELGICDIKHVWEAWA